MHSCTVFSSLPVQGGKDRCEPHLFPSPSSLAPAASVSCSAPGCLEEKPYRSLPVCVPGIAYPCLEEYILAHVLASLHPLPDVLSLLLCRPTSGRKSPAILSTVLDSVAITECPTGPFCFGSFERSRHSAAVLALCLAVRCSLTQRDSLLPSGYLLCHQLINQSISC